MLRQYLRTRFGKRRLNEVKRDDIKAMINDLIASDFPGTRSAMRSASFAGCSIRLSRRARWSPTRPRVSAGSLPRRELRTKGSALTAREAQQFLEAAKIVCLDHHPRSASLLVQNGCVDSAREGANGPQLNSGHGGHLRASDSRRQRLVCGSPGPSSRRTSKNNSATKRDPGATTRESRM